MTVTEQRRRGPARIEGVRAHPDRRTLTVTFVGELPQVVDRTRFVIEGGQQVVGVRVLRVVRERGEHAADGAPTQRFVLFLDRPGDDSTYRLCVLGAGFHGAYDKADFTFAPAAGRPEVASAAPRPPAPATAVVDYLAKDYASFRRLILERLSLTLPRWNEHHAPDLWITLVELFAHVGDRLSYQQDAVATEAYLDTARLRTSVRRHARLVGYPMHDGCAARTVVCVETSVLCEVQTDDVAFVALPHDPLGPDGGPVLPVGALAPGAQTAYRPLERRTVRLRPEHNGIPLWGWGQDPFPLPVGTTRAALLDEDRSLLLAPGDLLVLEEQHGAGGAPDPGHRQAVRLTRVVRDHDAETRTPVVKVAWAEEDALAFPLWVRNPPGPDGRPGSTVVARGNALLVEHGLEGSWLPDGDRSESITVPRTARAFTTTLRGSPVTWSPPHPRPTDLAAAQAQHLIGFATRARDLLRDLYQGPDTLTEEDRELLLSLFGTVGLDQLDELGGPTRLYARFDDVFAPQLRRLNVLARRAAGGSVLTPADVGWEIQRTWGAGAAAELHPDNPALHGPVSTALRPDAREALPVLDLVETDDETARWAPRRTLLESGPRDRHVVCESDDGGVLTLRFGDDRYGRAPCPDSSLRADYRVGNGRAGNAGSEAVNRVVHRDGALDGAVIRVRNPVPATGGTDPEPVAEVRLAAPRAPFRTLLRAVTADDYAVLAQALPGVQRAAAALRWNGSWYEVDVAVDPEGSAVPSPELLRDVRAALRPYRRIGHEVVTHPAQSVPLDVAVYVLVDPHHVTEHVRDALQQRFLPGDGGFFDPAALTFGTPVRTSALVAACMAVPGVRHAEVTRLRRLHAGGPGADDSDVPPSGELRMRPLEVPRLDGDVTRPENGQLVLRLRGGR
ncbi:putative baseplate assembly protein [Streptomyces sp. NPDC017979]|uniref:putative baseplate assembly protein n=1 Tax=Streptomyces sp. NPDC017979 TaxID=3365024 RepID=UPI0037AA564F